MPCQWCKLVRSRRPASAYHFFRGAVHNNKLLQPPFNRGCCRRTRCAVLANCGTRTTHCNWALPLLNHAAVEERFRIAMSHPNLSSALKSASVFKNFVSADPVCLVYASCWWSTALSVQVAPNSARESPHRCPRGFLSLR